MFVQKQLHAFSLARHSAYSTHCFDDAAEALLLSQIHGLFWPSVVALGKKV